MINVILRKEMGYYGRKGIFSKVKPRKGHTRQTECDGQFLMKGHGRIPLERICFVQKPHQRDLKDIKRELQVSLGYR